MYLLIYVILYMLPHTVMLICTFQLRLIQLLVKVLLLLYKNLIS